MDGLLRGVANGISSLFTNALAGIGSAFHGVVDRLATAVSGGGGLVIVVAAAAIGLLAVLVLRR